MEFFSCESEHAVVDQDEVLAFQLVSWGGVDPFGRNCRLFSAISAMGF